jgi:signal transduction histidine kinase
MTAGDRTAKAVKGTRSRHTLRLRLTAWYGGLFLVSGAALLAVTYALMVQAFAANAGTGGVACRGQRLGGSDCHIITAEQARAIAVDDHAAVLHELAARSAIALAIMAAVSVVLGWLIAGRALRPLRTITATARQISASSLNQRLAMAGPQDELKELADTFDGLLARLEGSFTAQRQFIANAAHELRTPLARQRVISQVALADPGATLETLRTAHQRVLASGTQQQQLVDALLILARGQAGLDKHEPFDLAELASKVLTASQPQAQRQDLTLHQALSPAPTAGNPQLAERLAANLIDNAVRHNLPGGQIDVATRTEGSRAILAVANTGPQVPAAALNRLFQPFQRLAADRTGSSKGLGLGLSIVHAIADAHCATISARARPQGGLLVEVAFPTPRPAPHAAHDANAHANTTAAPTSATATQLADRHPGSRSYETTPAAS